MLGLVIFLETMHVVYNVFLVLELIMTTIDSTCIVLEFILTCCQIIQEHDVMKRLIIFNTYLVLFVPIFSLYNLFYV